MVININKRLNINRPLDIIFFITYLPFVIIQFKNIIHTVIRTC